jgi:hypothetical protein
MFGSNKHQHRVHDHRQCSEELLAEINTARSLSSIPVVFVEVVAALESGIHA